MGLFEKKQENKAEVKAGNVLTIKVLGSGCKNCPDASAEYQRCSICDEPSGRD